MTIFKIHPASKADGSFAAAWFDNDAFLWDDVRLLSAVPSAEAWVAPSLKLYRPAERATDVLFNPNALAVSGAVKEALASFTELEFLPVGIEGHGMFHILHITPTIELPLGSIARIAPSPSGNLLEIEGFPNSFQSEHSFFRVLNPVGSAARRTGKTSRAIYASIAGARALQTIAGDYIAVSELPSV